MQLNNVIHLEFKRLKTYIKQKIDSVCATLNKPLLAFYYVPFFS